MQESEYLLERPLWVIFPERSPDDIFTATQGAEEVIVSSWKEFWNARTKEEKHMYLIHWNIPTSWRSALDFYFSEHE